MGQFLLLVILQLSAFPFFSGKTEKPATVETITSVEPRSVAIALRFDSLFNSVAQRKGFNGNVLVGIHGTAIYKNSFGYSDLKTKEPLNIKSVFQLASVSKQFTAIAIMMLHEKGKLDYTDTIQKFIPDFPYKNITIKFFGHKKCYECG